MREGSLIARGDASLLSVSIGLAPLRTGNGDEVIRHAKEAATAAFADHDGVRTQRLRTSELRGDAHRPIVKEVDPEVPACRAVGYVDGTGLVVPVPLIATVDGTRCVALPLNR